MTTPADFQKLLDKLIANSPSGMLEFRSYDDDAWYTADVAIKGEVLTVKFVYLTPKFKKKFQTSDFEDEQALQGFKERFRPISLQLQDSKCKEATEGDNVCASYVFSDGSVKFYDAVIDKVCHEDHSFDQGRELCRCQFHLCWKNGPNMGVKTVLGIENICLLEYRRVRKDPILYLFFERARKKLKLGSQHSSSVLDSEISTSDAAPFPEICKLTGKENKNPREGQATETFAGGSNVQKESGQDMGLKSVSSFAKPLMEKRDLFYIIVENIEKDVSTSTIVEFIRQHTSIECRACMDLSFSSAGYARGIIFVGSIEEMEKLYGFLQNPSHLILSSKGRPWIVVGKEQRSGGMEGLMQISEKSSDKIEDVAGKIRVVPKGTEEYEKGKHLADLFTTLSKALHSLHP